MRTAFFVVLFAAMACFGKNWTPYTDSCQILYFGADSVKHSKAYDLSEYENTRLTIMVDDTSSAGFSGDSINFRVGYSLGVEVLDSGGSRDTIWSADIWVDSLATANLGATTAGYQDVGAGSYTKATWIDTLSIAGYAVWHDIIVPDWAPFIRFSFEGLTGNYTGGHLDLVILPSRRLKQKTGL